MYLMVTVCYSEIWGSIGSSFLMVSKSRVGHSKISCSYVDVESNEDTIIEEE